MADKKKRGKTKAIGDGVCIEQSSIKPVLTVDYELYAHFLEDSDASEEEKREFVQTLWNIVVEFVSLGFGVHPLQQAQNTCGQDDKYRPKSALEAPDQLYLDRQFISQELNKVARPPTDSAGEGIET